MTFIYKSVTFMCNSVRFIYKSITFIDFDILKSDLLQCYEKKRYF